MQASISIFAKDFENIPLYHLQTKKGNDLYIYLLKLGYNFIFTQKSGIVKISDLLN
jgi:hypothetical protein